MRRQTPDHSARWQALTYVTIAALAITNAAWFYNWRARAVDHAQVVQQLRRDVKAAEPMIVYQYAEPRQPTRAQQPPPLAADERCMGGQVLRRIPNGWAGTGRRC